MARPSLLTKDLQAIDLAKDLQEGEVYIVKYNGAGLKRDIWIGVVIPESMLPVRFLNRRPRNAKPATGEWDVAPADRLYPVYLPGKNEYKRIPMKHFFNVGETPPPQFDTSKELARLFRALFKLSRKDGLTLNHWVDMANMEKGVKSGLGKKIFAVLPQELQLDENDADNLSDDEEEGSDALTEASSTSGMSPRTPSLNSQKRAGKSRSKIAKFMKISEANEKKGSFLFMSSASCSDQEASKGGNSASRSHHNTNTAANASKCSDDMEIDVYVGSGVDQKVLRIPFGQIKASPKLRDRVQLDETPYIFDPSLFNMPASKFEAIHTYLQEGDFEPKIIEKEGYPPVDKMIGAFGDQNGIGNKYILEGIDSAQELNALIPALGHVHQSAKEFGLRQLQKLAVLKLQVAWYTHSSANQLLTYLSLFESAFDPEDKIHFSFDPLQDWAARFLADTFEYYSRYHAPELWSVLGKNIRLQRSVCKHRAANLATDPTRYLNIEVQMATREEGLAGKQESKGEQVAKEEVETKCKKDIEGELKSDGP